jgi:hypothetical protein
LLEFSGILLRLTLEHTMRNVIDVAWQASKEQHEALDKKLLLELEQGKKKKSTTSPKEPIESTKGDDEEAESDDAGTSSTGIMSFARYMARYVCIRIKN